MLPFIGTYIWTHQISKSWVLMISWSLIAALALTAACGAVRITTVLQRYECDTSLNSEWILITVSSKAKIGSSMNRTEFNRCWRKQVESKIRVVQRSGSLRPGNGAANPAHRTFVSNAKRKWFLFPTTIMADAYSAKDSSGVIEYFCSSQASKTNIFKIPDPSVANDYTLVPCPKFLPSLTMSVS
ncbi:hypothetical protein EV421DRAFT_2024559 [Armillaria borealis]|uniref:Uncharacterized protein n=1 Tax=Armillaria borealis TaxID=47425 RepID=A0AA39MF28_9AGAR|nr:hypothetical protein EV421DRAFT_2024559 [Armillaria borealis]